ncbi:DUF3775 domain-containing protein [Flexibacterium corallicola]|uniref:DUF3775 domain-containing protein n=1 Tax=Flexibacterium corallicola TaxID=3037259 RepID=UPI00286F0602|nr:DUF3775 domain-containing protein [Pseudovibrio sp. M1P-2-3]
MAVELNLSVATIRMIVEKVRATITSVNDTYEDGHDGEVAFDPVKMQKIHAHDGLNEEEHADMREEEIRELLDDLNVDEAAELVTITWIGRGDFDAGDYELALAEAKERATGSTSEYLLGLPHLPDHLENGLDSLDL